MKVISDDGTKANIKVTESEVQQMIYTYERWIKTLCEEKKQLQQKVNKLETNRDVLKEYIQDLRYNIEPKSVRINFNCEYDSEEDYINGMKEQAQLEILKAILSKMQKLDEMRVDVKKEICSRDIRTGKLSRSTISIK